MTEDVNDRLLRELDADDDDGHAVRSLLAAGVPAYYRNADTPPGLEVKHHPDGRRELVRFHRDGDEVIGPLPDA
jgi:hypothetical protein